jgi:protocatechuate 3,4-dioxygenase beta subunit
MSSTGTDLDHDHDRGLGSDLSSLLGRRRLLQLIGGAGLATLVGCASKAANDSGTASTTADGSGATMAATTGSTGAAATTAATTSGQATTAIETIPEETAGPFPGDGSNGVNVLTESGVVRSDIRPSFGSSSGVAEGVPTTLELTVVDTANGGAPLAGAAVYVWHCDRDGRYSLYSQGATDENYLRGVQETDESGVARFTTIYPACYSGRWPHIHFEVYPSLSEATAAGSRLATSQVALPADVSSAVYATDGYEQSVSNLAEVSLDTDMVFRDGAELETPSVTGSATDGYVVSMNVGV